jgi:hypothetical protein
MAAPSCSAGRVRRTVVNLSLQFRLVLAPGLAAGRYPWPMRVAVRPLEAL